MINIKHVSIKEGDVIRVKGKIGDMYIQRTGTVAKIDENQWGRDYMTAQGISLLSVMRDGNTGVDKLVVQLFNHVPDTPLFDLTTLEPTA